ncbi:MAG: hypothetical protein ABI867_23985 [Kofleriaceae bacterium]
MKLALVFAALAALSAMPAIAGADVLNPPSGPVDDGEAEVAEPMPVRNDSHAGRGDRMRRDPTARRVHRQRLRQALLAEFDVNGDGRLGPRERQRAVRVLRRIEGRMAGHAQRGGGQQQRAAKLRKFIQRHDRNGDGSLGPDEVPAGAANKLRRFDRDGDGWVEPRDVAPRR